MKNTTKYLVTIFIITLTIIFAVGCTNVSVDASITKDHLVTYTYNITVDDIDEEDLNYDELQLFFLDIKKYWEEEGLKCELLMDNDTINLTGVLSKQCMSREEAFDTLYEYMTHKTSIFDDVTLNYKEDFYKTDYALVAHLDLSGVIDEDVYSVYPQIVGDDVNAFMDGFKASVTISLPADGDAVQGEANVIEKQSITDVSLDEPTEILLNGTITNTQNTESENDLVKAKSNSKTTIIISGIIALLSITGLIILMFIKRNMKLDDEDEPKENDVEKGNEEE